MEESPTNDMYVYLLVQIPNMLKETRSIAMIFLLHVKHKMWNTNETTTIME